MSAAPGTGPGRHSSDPSSTRKRDGHGDRQQCSAKAGSQPVKLSARGNHCGSQGVDSCVLAGNYFMYLNLNSPNRL